VPKSCQLSVLAAMASQAASNAMVTWG
jgi:hypothetical protein